MLSSREKGRQAERSALAFYLQDENVKCLKSNYQKRSGEIDLILYDENKKMIIFVEVKSGQNCDFEVYTNSITEKKVKKITKVAAEFIENLDIEYEDIRFDAVFIERDNERTIRQLINVIRLN